MADSIFKQIQDATVTAIGTLTLAGTPTIVAQKQPWSPNSVTVGIVVCPALETMGTEGVNSKNDIGYGLLVAMSQPGNQDLTSNIERLTHWRQMILRKFHDANPLTSIASVYVCKVEPGPVFDWGAFLNGWDTSSFVIRVWTREARDTTV